MMYNESLTWKKQQEGLLWEFLKIFLGANLIAIFSHIKIFLPNNPIPIVFQTTVVLLLAVVMGRKAAFSVLLFLLEGAFGLPVFAKGGGLLYFTGATGGYLLGYFVAAYVVGIIMEVGARKTLKRAFYAMVVGKLIIFLFGVIHFSSFVGVKNAIWLGVVPFLGPDLLKIFFNIGLLKYIGWEEKQV